MYENEKFEAKQMKRKEERRRDGGIFIIDRINHHSDEFMRATY